MDFLLGRNKPTINRNTMFRITEAGKARLTDNFSDGDPHTRILIALETRGSSNIVDLSRATGVTVGRLEREMSKLVNNGYVISGVNDNVYQ